MIFSDDVEAHCLSYMFKIADARVCNIVAREEKGESLIMFVYLVYRQFTGSWTSEVVQFYHHHDGPRQAAFILHSNARIAGNRHS